MNSARQSTRPASPWLALLLAGLVLNLLLAAPAWWRDGYLGSVWLVPEAWLVPALLACLPRGFRSSVRALAAVALSFAVIAGSFDGLVQSVLGRPLNVFIDPLMLQAGFHLIHGSLGLATAVLASLTVALTAVGVFFVVNRLLGTAASRAGGAAIVLCVAVLLIWAGAKPLDLAGVQSQLLHLAGQQAREFDQTRTARRRLIEAADDPAFEARPLPGLAGRDVYVVFVESYGESALDDPRYAEALDARRPAWNTRLEQAGLSVVSRRLEAPIRGGQSWLSHASLLSGLPIDNQLFYRMLLDRDIDLLSDDFRATGHTAINLAPAIVMEWPEGRELGFDRIFAADDLGYEGPRLGWATMPDEYTLHALSERIRPQFDGPVFAQVALISSHWPWRPIPELVGDHGRIGRGRVYERWNIGGAGSVLEQFDLDRLRGRYIESIAYSLDATFAWAGRHLPDDALLIVLGDHQPASIVTGRGVGSSVPVHVVSGASGMLEPFKGRGFDEGLRAEPSAAPAAIGDIRRWLRAGAAGD